MLHAHMALLYAAGLYVACSYARAVCCVRLYGFVARRQDAVADARDTRVLVYL